MALAYHHESELAHGPIFDLSSDTRLSDFDRFLARGEVREVE